MYHIVLAVTMSQSGNKNYLAIIKYSVVEILCLSKLLVNE